MTRMRFIIFIVLMMISGVFTNAQNTIKLIAVVNQANWCPACRANSERMKTEVFPKINSAEVQLIINDMSNKKTNSQSEEQLKNAGCLETVEEEPGTGQILLIDPKSKKIVKKVSVTKGSEEILEVIRTALKS